MRVILVDNLLFENIGAVRHFDLQPHLGLISLLGAIENVGHEAVLFDPKLEVTSGRVPFDEALYRSLAKAIVQREPDVVGFTSLGCNFICTAKIASYVRAARADVPILLGGPHATILDRQILERFPQFDLVVRHEAELTLPQVLEALPGKQFDPIPGITFRDGHQIVATPGAPLISDLDLLPWPAFQRYPLETLGLSSIRVEAGRGCPFSCSFCSTASFFGRQYRLKSAARICRELDFLNARYGICHFSLTHDLFTVNRSKVLEFCETVRGRRYTWSCSARMDCVDRELLMRMQEAGCRSVYYGIETGSPRLQLVIQKRQDLGMFSEVLDATHALKISCTVSFITGYPQEELNDQNQTLDLIGTCFSRDPKLVGIQLHLLTPEPGTQLMNQFRQNLQYDGHISDFNFPTLESDDAEIMAENPNVFMNHHYFSSALPRSRHIFVTQAFQSLYGLGFPVLAALVSLFGGRLSSFISDFLAWSVENPEQAASDCSIVQFLRLRFGADHVITSLVRYSVAVNRLTAQQAKPASVEVLPGKFVLKPRIADLRDIHDCGKILNWLTVGNDLGSLSEELCSGRQDILIEIEGSENVGDRLVRDFRLDSGTAAAIEYFHSPRSKNDFVRLFQTSVDNAEKSFEYLKRTVLTPAVVASPLASSLAAP